MEAFIGFADMAASIVLLLSLFIVVAQVTRQAKRLRPLTVALGLLALILISPAFPPYSIVASAGGYLIGIVRQFSKISFGILYRLAVYTALAAVLLDLLQKSGIARFGLPSFESLITPPLAASIITESVVGSLATALAVFACWGLGLLAAVFCGVRGSRRVGTAAFVVVVLGYLIEPHLHLTIEHPLFVHHPLFTISTGIGLVLGILGGRAEAFPDLPLAHTHRPLLATVAYFTIYHFVLDVSEHTYGWMFDISYGTTMALTIAITLPFGNMLGRLWQKPAASAVE